jgi:hypothetical protein
MGTCPAMDRCVTEGEPMPLTLRTTLRETRDVLHMLRRTVARRGHIKAMQDIDALIGVAESETVRAIKIMDMAKK